MSIEDNGEEVKEDNFVILVIYLVGVVVSLVSVSFLLMIPWVDLSTYKIDLSSIFSLSLEVGLVLILLSFILIVVKNRKVKGRRSIT